MSGWIKLHRKITEHWIWEDPEKLKWWLDLIMLANHEPKDILINNEIVKIDVGMRHTSEQKLADRWNCSRKKVSNFLKLLELEGMIKISKSRQKGTTYKVIKYADYQAKKEIKEHQKNNESTTEEHQKNNERTTKAHKQELKELKELEELEEAVRGEGKNATGSDTQLIESFFLFEKLWLFPNMVQRETLQEFIELYSDDLVSAAIKIAGSKDVKKGQSIAFIEAVLKEWVDGNVKTLEEAREYEKNRGKQKKPYKNNKFSKPVRKQESLPEWAQEEQSSTQDDEIVEDESMKERLARIREMREVND